MAALDFPSNPTNGQTYENFIFDSSITAWRNQGSPSGLAGQVVALDNKMGLKQIIPTTVTAVSGTATVSSLGVITATNVNGILIDGVFSSKYRNYIIECEIGGSTHLGLQLRTAGTSNATNNYSLSGFYTPGNSINYNNQQYLSYMQVGWQNLGHVSLKISSPAHDKATNIVSQEDGYDGGTDRPHHTALAGYFGPATLFDGLRLYGISNVFAGNISIYGMNEQVYDD